MKIGEAVSLMLTIPSQYDLPGNSYDDFAA
jgi:hypothetical protein